MAAGLAGGSTDAAATLLGLDALWRLGLPRERLAELAGELGSDIPFFLQGTAAWCTGRGEKVEPVALAATLHMVVVSPPQGLSTAEVYRGVTVPDRPVSPKRLRQALEQGEVQAIGAALHNRLQAVAEEKSTEVRALRELFTGLGTAGHLMSGSGSSYFALCRSQAEAIDLARQLQQCWGQPSDNQQAGKSHRVFVVHSLAQD
jgi:4-diphosphocytidyl-2-C-methyl-D-erythritol kinase